ncbi:MULTISPECIES: hypothetical protein [unclassified Clostridium]|uniref:hypothetical protein n=1 Tax=unclassified Clostridium TaxID=2614128 RepID=UPI001D9BCB29|nr:MULTISPECIES: hypothetical protein [unclassified Clostridium]MBN1044495.1 hypothetical protein [Clostridium botulinum]
MKELILKNIDFDLYYNSVNLLDTLNTRNKMYYDLLFRWIKNKNKNRNICDWLIKNGISRIGIYGAGNLGELLFSEIINCTNIKISYVIDKNNFNNNLKKIPIIKFEQITDFEKVDCIIVTPIYAYEEIKVNLEAIGIEKVICLDEIIFELNIEEGESK